MINGEQDLETISSLPHAPEFLDLTSTDGSSFMMERSPKLKCTIHKNISELQQILSAFLTYTGTEITVL